MVKVIFFNRGTESGIVEWVQKKLLPASTLLTDSTQVEIMKA